jgi:hypothetical protein
MSGLFLAKHGPPLVELVLDANQLEKEELE